MKNSAREMCQMCMCMCKMHVYLPCSLFELK